MNASSTAPKPSTKPLDTRQWGQPVPTRQTVIQISVVAAPRKGNK